MCLTQAELSREEHRRIGTGRPAADVDVVDVLLPPGGTFSSGAAAPARPARDPTSMAQMWISPACTGGRRAV
jgi:hypothetical protein